MTRARRRVLGLRRRWATLRDGVRSELWPGPVVGIVIAVAVGILLPDLDRRIDDRLSDSVAGLLFGGGADSARSVLGTISSSVLSVATLTFSLTVVALQQASSQASPRLLRLFAADPMVHWTLSSFLGTFTYALVVLRTVRNESSQAAEFVPRISVTLATVATLACIVLLVLFLAHLARLLRVETMLRDVHAETVRTIGVIDQLDDDETEPVLAAPATAATIDADRSGFVTTVDRDRLLALAAKHDVAMREEQAVGASVITGAPLVSWWPLGGEVDAESLARGVRRAVDLGYERTAAQDVGFGLRQLTDVVTRALSPGTNDPTTAVHGLSYLADLLTRLFTLDRLRSVHTDRDGTPRFVSRTLDLGAQIEGVLAHPRHYGAADPEVAGRMFQLLDDLARTARTDEHREIVRVQTALLDDAVREAGHDAHAQHRFDTVRDRIAARLDHPEHRA